EGAALRPLLLGELPWLQAENSSAAFCLAYRLGKLDPQRALLPELIRVQQGLGADVTTTFLSGYLASVHDAEPGRWEEIVLALADAPVLREQLPDVVISSGMTDAAARRVAELCRSGASDPKRLERWWFSGRLRQIDEQVFLQLVELQLAGG